MAVRIAIASGNWSNPAIWDDGIGPVAGDIVYLNSFTIAADQDINVESIRSTASTIFLPNMCIPIMTGTNTPSGVASASSINGVAFAWRAFDQNLTSEWAATGATGWLKYQFSSSKIIRRYSILGSSNITLNPRNWTFEGSNDDVNWTILQTVTLGSGIPASTWYDSGVFANATPYLYYRINITLNGGSTNLLYVHEFQMTESTSTVVCTNTSGGINITSNRTITCTDSTGIINGGATSVLTLSTASTIIINSNLRAGQGNALLITGVGHIVTVNGDVNASNTTGSRHGINRQANGQLNINGNVTGGTSNSYGVLINDTGTLNVVGDLFATDLNANGAAAVSITQNGNVNITGNVWGALFNNSSNFGILASTASTINIIGNVSGSFNSSSNFGINLTGGTILNITGNVVAGTGASFNNYAIQTTSASNITINGYVAATTACNAIFANSFTTSLTVNGVIQNANNRMAVYSPNLYIGNAVTQWVFFKPDNSNRTLYSADTLSGTPATTDVRQGTTYGAGGSLTGTLEVPPASSVAVGVPVDNTVGTAIISITDMGALLASYNV